jgi:hypothetical protein
MTLLNPTSGGINPKVYLKNIYLPAEALTRLGADKIFEMYTQGVS